jgi:chromosome segregation ATPase
MTELQGNQPAHEQLFDEICGKLQELSLKKLENFQDATHATKTEPFSERLEKMQTQLRKSQEELKVTQQEIHDKIRSLDSMNFPNNDLNREVKRISEQLDQERMNNSKLSTDLAKSLELNLRLQFEIEEIRSKANQHLVEEKKHNVFLQDKVKTLTHELDLSQALANETRLELAKAKEKFQLEHQGWLNEKRSLQTEIQDHVSNLEDKKTAIQALRDDNARKDEELQRSAEAMKEYDVHTQQLNDMMRTLSDVAEKKMIELKLALDKKTIESQDYYSHLQQAMTQIHVLRQENAALKDYIAKLTALHQQRANQAQQS